MKKVLSLLLTMGYVLPMSVAADTNGQTVEIDGAEAVQIIQEGEDLVQYTYVEDGDHYKVNMYLSEYDRVIHNEVFKQNEKGEYELIRTTEFITDREHTHITSVENGQTNSFTIDTPDVDDITKEAQTEGLMFTTSNYADLGPWTYSFTSNYRQDIQGMARDAIAATLVGIYNWKAGAAITAAGIINAMNTDAFWVKDEVYYKYIKGTSLPRGERSKTTIYADKANQHYIEGPHYYDTYTTGWGPND
ncbi:hypothetical protein PQ478_11590 [Alkalihalophilus pseudofirmus]|uniref:hypothetical protein n=1 Tax=Alkalihalophilus pseudofirmus TaxID=79885 RepID=UPI00259B75EF|nr:hypothetical protein [Alkalihalophilus pseudofirmus]WEG15182.1 hypothetical protein PQ478_11590 [Alkalihalophilus pseudofirmus]